MITLESLRGSKRAEILRLARAHGARNVRIFGSVVRGTNRDESDVDFLMEFDVDRTLFDLIELKSNLQELIGAEVDIVTPKSLRYLRDRILAEAQPL